MDCVVGLGEKPDDENEAHRDSDREASPEPKLELGTGENREAHGNRKHECTEADDWVREAQKSCLRGDHYLRAGDPQVDVARERLVRVLGQSNSLENECEGGQPADDTRPDKSDSEAFIRAWH